ERLCPGDGICDVEHGPDVRAQAEREMRGQRLGLEVDRAHRALELERARGPGNGIRKDDVHCVSPGIAGADGRALLLENGGKGAENPVREARKLLVAQLREAFDVCEEQRADDASLRRRMLRVADIASVCTCAVRVDNRDRETESPPGSNLDRGAG